MSDATLGAGKAIEDVARRLAARQAESLGRYSGLLSKFGSAQINSRDLGENLYKLAVEESARAFGDAVEFGVGYWRGVFSAVAPNTPRPSPAGRTSEPRTKPTKPRRKKAGPPRSRK